MLKAMVTGLVLTLSTAAFAAPGYDAPSHSLPDNAHHGSFKRRPPMMKWQTLASSKRVSAHSAFYVRSSDAFSKLKLEAAAGTTFVDKVLITFGNGRTQLIDLDKRLSARDPLVIDLDGNLRKISKVEVFGRSGRRAAINVLAV
jgi:hypothetical protein